MPRIPRLVVPGYPHHVTQRENWRGHLWQERFHSFVMDEPHLDATVRYVELNPVSARLVERPQDWRWSSVHAHLKANDDGLVTVKPMLEKFPDWMAYLGDRQSNDILRKVRKHTKTGRPLGSERFIETLESLTGRSLKPLKPGRKPIK